jgi:CRP/FNR family transcriptional regulator, cyclic AMP receptor protein
MLLKNIPLFSTISDDDLARLSELLQTRNVAANQAIFWIGENGDELFIVQSGGVRLSYINENGQEITLAVVGSGAFFGDLSLLDGGPRTATAIAQSDSLLWVLNRAAFFNFLEGHPKVAQVMVSTLATRMRENMEKLKSIKNINEEVDEQITPLQKLVDKAADTFSSGRFLLANVVVFLPVDAGSDDPCLAIEAGVDHLSGCSTLVFLAGVHGDERSVVSDGLRP